LKSSNTIILANHGTVTFGPDLEKAYWNTEIIDAYCNILILSKQLGRVNFFNGQQTKELLDLKKKLGYDDVRFHLENCDLCSNDTLDRGYSDFNPQPRVFGRESAKPTVAGPKPSANGHAANEPDMDKLVELITEQVVAALQKA
jgi:L-fuculose-phosphate aldolase